MGEVAAAVGVAYLVWKRQWKPALLAVGWVVVLDVVLSLVAYGPTAAWHEHVKWWQNEGAGALGRQLNSPAPIDEDRLTNQSLAVTLRRTLTRFGMSPGNPRNWASLVDLNATQLKAAFLIASGVLGLAVFWVCRRPGGALSPRQWALEIGLMLLATLWFSPVVWSYHPTAAAPALAMVLAHRFQRPGWVWAIGLIWVAGLVLLASLVARAFGELLWATVAVGVGLMWLEYFRAQPRAVGQASGLPANTG